MGSYKLLFHALMLYLKINVIVAESCGPDKKCSCSIFYGQIQYLTMNCSRTRVHLHNVCAYLERSKISLPIRLDVRQNNISNLNKPDLEGCVNVSTLTLSRNQINSLAPDIFSDMAHLYDLDVSKNRLSSIYLPESKQILVGLPNLKHLKLNGNFRSVNQTKYSYPNISSLRLLESLTIDGMPDTRFGKSYQKLTRLDKLNLNGSVGICNLGQIDGYTFENVPYIETLDLSRCNITNIHKETFGVLHRLRWLDLSLNRKLGLRVLRNVSFGLQNTQIDFVNYSRTQKTFGLGTQLTKKDVCFLRNTTLREISLAGNRIELFEDNLPILLPPTFQILHVDENRFTFGPYLMQLGCLTNVTEITNNRQNQMHDPRVYSKQNYIIPDDVVPIPNDCPYMKTEYLKNTSASIPGCNYMGRNPIDFTKTSLPPKFKKMSFAFSNVNYPIGRIPILPFDNDIEYIDVSGNVLYSWTGPIGPFPSVRFLNLSRNYCSFIGPDFFSLMPSLEVLDIRNNFVEMVIANDVRGQIFKPLKKLRYLVMSTNQIKTLPPSVLQYLESLEHLDLSHNTIDEFTLVVSYSKNLTSLDLSNNAIQTLPINVVDHFRYLSDHGLNFSINLYKNQIRCSCAYRGFLEWMMKYRTSFELFENYTFINENGQPITLQEFISRVNNFDKSCRSYTIVIVICSIAFTLFITTVLVGIIYKNRWKLRYILYMNKRRFYGYLRLPDEDPIENFRYDAFISYSDCDIRFVLDEIIPHLEEEYGLNLCIHQRNFLPGNAIADNIIEAIKSSRRTVVILSRTFLTRKWCQYEFNMARMESIYSRNDGGCLIVVMLEGVPTKEMQLEMLNWIKEESYIEFTRDEEGYELFWNNLKDAIMTNRR